jgi:hypothetical protein
MVPAYENFDASPDYAAPRYKIILRGARVPMAVRRTKINPEAMPAYTETINSMHLKLRARGSLHYSGVAFVELF